MRFIGSEKICFPRRLTILLLFIFTAISVYIFFTGYLSSQKLSTRSKAAERTSKEQTEDTSPIKGGVDATPDEFPFVTFIHTTDEYWKKNNRSILCTGVLVKPGWVLTAHHCMKRITSPSDIYVIVNDIDASHTSSGRINVIKIIPNTEFDFNNIRHDIALLQLKKEITDITLPQLPDGENLYSVGKQVIAIGYGALAIIPTPGQNIDFKNPNYLSVFPQKLQKISLPIVKSIIPFTSKFLFGYSDETSLQKSIMVGDSGGPVVVYENNSYYLLGIISGSFSGTAVYPNEATKIIDFIDWIEKTN